MNPASPLTAGDADLNDYFLNDSAGHALQLLSVTYALENDSETIAFFSVLNDRIQKDDGNKGLFRKLRKQLPPDKHYGSYPAVKVGRFGVSKAAQRQHIGTDVMNYIKILFVDRQQKTGCRFITVDAYNTDCVIRFYENNGFKFLTEADKESDTRAMYFDLMPIANYQAASLVK